MKIVIAKDGFNALTETDPENLVYSSDYDTLKYYVSGSASVSPPGSSAELILAHNLGYVPFFVALVKGFGGADKYNMCPGYTASMAGYIHADCYADATNLYFKVHTNYLNSAIEFRYFIFRNRIDL